MLNCVQFMEMEQVVMEDREEQEKLRQQQAEARAATKVTTSNQNSDPCFTIMHYQINRSDHLLYRSLFLTCSVTFNPTAAGLVEGLHGPPGPR